MLTLVPGSSPVSWAIGVRLGKVNVAHGGIVQLAFTTVNTYCKQMAKVQDMSADEPHIADYALG
jgi:hypothetical protein